MVAILGWDEHTVWTKEDLESKKNKKKHKQKGG